MKKIDTMFFLSLPVICTLPISLCSLQANDYKDEKEKIKDYCLFDYIKLTGRQDAQIEGDLIPLKNSAIKQGYAIKYTTGGYSIFSNKYKLIYMVNPFGYFYMPSTVNFLNNFYGRNNDDVTTFDKPVPGDHKRPPKVINPNDYVDFRKINLKNVKNATKQEYKKYNINPIKNNFMYADYEVKHSWWFKSSTEYNYGDNVPEGSYIDNDLEQNNYWRKYPSYYTKTGYYRKTAIGICGYIAMNMLIQYNEFFNGSGYYSDFEYDKFLQFEKNFSNITANNAYYDLYHYTLPTLRSDFTNYLYQKTWFGGGVGRIWEYKYIADSLILNKWKLGNINYKYWSPVFQTWDHSASYIRDYGVPTAIGGNYAYINKNTNDYGGHVIVAYGAYKHDHRFLANFGWTKTYSQVVLYPSNWNDVIAIKHIKGQPLKKVFNWENELYSGPMMTEILREKGII